MLWIPGPTEVRPELLAECSRPAIGHRSPAMRELIERLDPHLPLAFGLDADSKTACAVHSVSASGLMEASLHGVGSRVLSVVNGAFSKRFRDMGQLMGKEVVTIDVAWGSGVDPEELDQRRHADLFGRFCHIGRRLDPETRNTPRHKVAQ